MLNKQLKGNYKMKKLIATTALLGLISSPLMAADKDMSCAEINAEMTELNNIATAAGNAETADTVAGASAAAAGHAAVLSGAGSSVPLIGSVFNIGKSVTRQNKANAQAKADDAEKRTIKLETIAEMKGCE